MDEIKLKAHSGTDPVIGQPLTVREAMSWAIIEAYKGATRVSPNPPVGCVVLDSQGKFLSKGFHEYFGGPHAEVNAVQGLTEAQLQGAHVIVTLEPCAHQGKTPSCAQMLARKSIAKVTYGLEDPNPLVKGQGAEILRKKGIQVEIFAELKEELEEVCEIFLWNFRQKKVFVSLKLASSLDGIVALANGESRWITNEVSREYSHYLRAVYDAILVGGGTVGNDNPRLDIRHPQVQKENKVVVLDTDAELLKRFYELEVSKAHKHENIFWCVADDLDLKEMNLPGGPQILKVKRGLSHLNMDAVFESLWSVGVRSVFVEGGAKVASSLIENGLINRLYLFQAPIILGQKDSFSWTSHLRTSTMAAKIQLYRVKHVQFQSDLLTTGLFQIN